MTEGAARTVAQAKVNLALAVLAREEGGYHQIETLFQRIALGDVVHVRAGGSARALDAAGPAMPPEGLGPVERNLAWRAAERYALVSGWPRGFAIEIEKRVPVGGGLGGGSADAAAVLRILNALAPEPLSPMALLQIAVRLGADVPFLASGASLALAWGRGERMLALPALPAREVALVVPDFGVGTAEAYGWIAESRREHPPAPHAELLVPESLATWAQVELRMRNDFQPVVGERHPRLLRMVRALRERLGASAALMSGSGSSLFALYDAPPDAAAIARETGARVLLTRTAARVEEVVRTE